MTTTQTTATCPAIASEPYVPPTLVTCHKCGWVHFVVSAKAAQAEASSFNEYAVEAGIEQRADFQSYLKCFSCGTDSAGFVPAKDDDCPDGCTLQPTVVER